jgi:hypothetical protein
MSNQAKSLEEEVLDHVKAEEDAFKKRFPQKDFLEVAQALKIRDRKIFVALVRRLRSDFDLFYGYCQAKRPSRDAEIERVRELRDAANLLVFADDDLSMPIDLLSDEFVATATQLATFWEKELTKLKEAPSSVGRPPQEAFRELIVLLIRTYQRFTRKRATRPSTRFNKQGYHSEFYDFAIAAWRCLRRHLPEAARLMPYSEGALAEALRNHWPKKGTAGYKLIL